MCEFSPGDVVQHKNGEQYRIIGKGLYEPNCSSVYIYQHVEKGVLWVRPLHEMEDGRFVLVAPGP